MVLSFILIQNRQYETPLVLSERRLMISQRQDTAGEVVCALQRTLTFWPFNVLMSLTRIQDEEKVKMKGEVCSTKEQCAAQPSCHRS